MSGLAIAGLILGLIVLVVAMVLIIKDDESGGTEEDALDDIERAYWQEQLDKQGADFGLATTRAAAGKWGASAAAILGVLTAVAVVAGPSDLAKDVGGDEAVVAAVLVLLAAGVAAIATLLAGLAEQGSPVAKADMTAGKLRRLTRERANRAAEQIRWSRILTTTALCLLVAAAGVAWLAALTGPEAPLKGPAAVIVDSARAECGELSRNADGVLVVAVGDARTPVSTDARVTVVEACPK